MDRLMGKMKFGTWVVTFTDGTEIVCGNNYKHWSTHATEYVLRKYGEALKFKTVDLVAMVQEVRYSGVPFVDDGGLKWASPEAYQEVIDEEAAKQHQTFTPFKDIKFTNSYYDKQLLRKKIEKY